MGFKSLQLKLLVRHHFSKNISLLRITKTKLWILDQSLLFAKPPQDPDIAKIK